jgi:hypothetical protein
VLVQGFGVAERGRVQAAHLPTAPEIIKLAIKKGLSWETARAPFDVTFSCEVRALVASLQSTTPLEEWHKHSDTLGSPSLPRGLQMALSSLAVGEISTFVMPTALLKASANSTWAASHDLPPGHQCCIDIVLHSFVEVRDMTGDGKVWSLQNCRHAQRQVHFQWV